MTEAWKHLPFAGIGGVSGGVAHSDYIATLYDAGPGDTTALKDAIEHLESEYSITTAEVAYDDPDLGWTETGRHQALVNPAWLGEDGLEDAPQGTALWHIPTREYTPITPMEKYGPLLARLRARDYHESAAGELRLFRNGGEVHADLWLDDLRTGDDDEIVMGVQTGHDYFGGKALYASIIAYDEQDGRVMRGLSEKRSRRHTGSAKADVAEWWDTVLDQAEDACDTLAEVILDAQDYVIDFAEIPLTPKEYLVYAFGGTEYLAENDASADGQTGGALEYLPVTSENASLSGWEFYKAMASALTHDFHGKDDSTAVRRYVRRSNRQLFSPPRMEDGVLSDYADDIEGQEDLDGDDLLDSIRARQESIGEAVQTARSDKDRLKTLVEEAEAAEQEAA